MSNKTKRSAEEKIALINDVCGRFWFYQRTETFTTEWEGCNTSVCMGVALAYLVWAIADDGSVSYDKGEAGHRFLKLYFPHDHAVWEYVEIEESEV